MLSFVGLGLYDERSITVRGQDVLRAADRAVAEFYTSRLCGADVESLETFHDVTIEVLDRTGVEVDPSGVLKSASEDHVVFLTGGDPMVSTTHVDLRLRAVERGIDTQIVHAPSISTAAAGLTGLQNYRFGKATTIPFPGTFSETPQSIIETIEDNQTRGLHTLCYLDLDEDGEESLSASRAAESIVGPLGDDLGVVVARAGSDDPLVTADRIRDLAKGEFGSGLHVLVIPGDLHEIEADALETIADAPAALLPATR